MKMYITRHAQTLPSEFKGDELYQPADRPITPLGETQADYLGRHLAKIGFDGLILCSPFRRTFQTAAPISLYTGIKITPFQYIYEVFRNDEAAREFRYMNTSQVRERFDNLVDDFTLSEHWFSEKAETDDEIEARCCLAIQKATEFGRDCLLVSHGDFTYALTTKLGYVQPAGEYLWNCNLSCVEFEDGRVINTYFNDVSFLPPEIVTVNSKFMLPPAEKK